MSSAKSKTRTRTKSGPVENTDRLSYFFNRSHHFLQKRKKTCCTKHVNKSIRKAAQCPMRQCLLIQKLNFHLKIIRKCLCLVNTFSFTVFSINVFKNDHFLYLLFFQKMATNTGRYNAWFDDPRYSKRYDMSMTLFFHKTEFCGFGKDGIGLFVVKNGVLNTHNKNISFLKSYHTHTVKYTGILQSRKTPLKAEGKWHLSNSPRVTGTWGMVLQGSPSHGALPHPDHPTRSKWEEWGHNILQWVPMPFVATAWDGGASLFYALTGNAAKAKERLYDMGVDAAFDVLCLATGGGSELALGVSNSISVISTFARKHLKG